MDVNHFLRLVREELDRIKSNATAEEIGRLDFSTLDHESKSSCIYGQMTGNCHSDRAFEIMDKSLISLNTELPKDDLKLNHFGPNNLLSNKYPRFTYLEQYLFWSSSSTDEKIISYLKGEIDDIVLELDFDKFP